MCLELQPVQQEDLSQSKADRQEAFQLGAQEGGFSTHGRQILPEGDIDHSLCAQGSIAYKAVLDGEMAGGAILSLDVEKHHGYLDFLYVRHDVLEKGIGKFMWFEIERLHPDVRVWGYVRPTLKSEACIFTSTSVVFMWWIIGMPAIKTLIHLSRSQKMKKIAISE